MADKRLELNEADGWDELSVWDAVESMEEKVAFIKHDFIEGKSIWGIYDAEGVRLAATESRDFAFVVARQNDYIPYSVH